MKKYLSKLTIKKKQTLLAGIGGALGMGAFLWLMTQVFTDSEYKPIVKEKDYIKETNINTVGKHLKPHEIWIERIESESKILSKKIDQMEKLLEESVKAVAKRPAIKPYEAPVIGEKTNIVAPAKTEILPQLAAARSSNKGFIMPSKAFTESLGGSPSRVFPKPVEEVRKISKTQINLKPQPNASKKKKKKIKTSDNRVPAGSFVKGLLLSGVDASTSIQASADPRPVLLKVTDKGTLPRSFKMDLKGCHIIGAAVGDLSSERVFVRVEKLTCTEKQTGEIIETQIAGYVSGEDGKAGIRGIVADKSPQMMQNAFFSGFLSGASSFIGAQQTKSVFPVSPFGQTNALSAKQLGAAGASSGAGKALDKMSDFYIQRAEQLQPVIQVSAGRNVDVVFTEGTNFGDTRVRETLEKVRDAKRDRAVEQLQFQEQSKEYIQNF